MKFKKYIKAHNRFVFGNNTFAEVDKRIFILVTYITIIIAIIGNISNIILGLGLELILITASATLIIIFFYLISRNSLNYRKYIIPFFFFTIILLSLLWFYNGGYDGNNLILIFVCFIAFFSIAPQQYRNYVLLIYFILIGSLIFIQYKYPLLIKPYDNSGQRFVDLFVGSMLFIFLAYSVQRIILNIYSFEQKRAKLRNNQLKFFNSKLSEVNKRLEITIEKMNEAVDSRDRVFSIISHDLRSPFQSILCISGMLGSDYDKLEESDKKLMISQLNQALVKQYNFLGELLIWGKIKKDNFKPILQVKNIKEVILNSIQIFKTGLALKKINLEVNCNEKAKADLDEALFATLTRNIVSNAIKFSYEKSTIYISLLEEENEYQISVKDTGIGIEQENLSKLFNIEQRYSIKGTNDESGFGLGLLLCNDIIKKHNGRISVSSKLGKGSVFTLHIPKHINKN